IGNRRALVVGTPPDARRLVPRGQIVSGDAALVESRLRDGGWVLVSLAIARELNLRAGDRFTLPAPIPTTFRIAAISSNVGGPPGAIVLNADDYARAWGTPANEVSALTATLAPGERAADAARELRTRLGPSSGLSIQTAAQRDDDQRVASRQGLTRLT